MLNPALKRFILPFAPQKNSEPFNTKVEEAAVYALVELERMKGGGLILKQPEEKLVFLTKFGYPLWLFPKNESTYIFDDLKNTKFTLSYSELPSTKVFMDSLEANSKTREDFMAFLSDHSNYFLQAKKEKELSVGNLIVDFDFKKEFNAYRREAVEVTGQMANYVLLPPTLQEAAVSSVLTEIADLQTNAKEDADKLAECLRLIKRATSQYVTDLDYAAEAVRDEANAQIKAQQEFINPKVAALNTQYKRHISEVTKSFDQELEKLEKQKATNEKRLESDEDKIRLYQKEADAQASKNHSIYEKRWKEKSTQTKKELNAIKKELKRAEKNIKNLTKQKKSQAAKLQLELDAEIKHARQPLLDLEASRDAKMLVFKKETEKLLKLEKPVTDGLNDAIKLGEAINAKFTMLGSVDSELKSPSLFYVSFYAACYQTGLNTRFIFLPPSTASAEGFSSKLKGVLGRSKLKQLLTPRFKTISALIDNVQILSKQDSLLESQIRDLGEKTNLLNIPMTRSNLAEGLLRLRSGGWLSDKEYQVVSNSLS
jgi:tRNA uridine 5-carbamoylmethylation protein Kti12